MTLRPKRILIDASHTIPSGLNTGVQRVVRNTYENIPLVEPEIECKPVVVNGGSFHALRQLKSSRFRERLLGFESNILAHMPASYRLGARGLCRVVPSRKLKSWLLPMPGHKGIFKIPLRVCKRVFLRPETMPVTELGAGDLLVLPDAYWVKKDIWPVVAAAKQRGVVVATIVYDLIPLTHPQFVAAGASGPFREYLMQVGRHSDLIIAISDVVREATQQALAGFLPGEDVCSDIRSFPLGAEFTCTGGAVRPQVRNIFEPSSVHSPYLMVATFDPRKNHSYLLDAFELVWRERPSQKLCLVGRIGWLCDDVVARIQAHPRLGKQLFMINDASDAELNYCYERSRAVVFPSIVEGFGLPIVEALWHGRHVFASDTPIHREVGGDECIYFDLSCPSHLAAEISRWEARQVADLPTRKSAIKPLSWRESVRILTDHCLDVFAKHAPRASRKSRAA
jgi:O-antigen biosynthesis alpha-1,2-rhamnosyltransferase